MLVQWDKDSRIRNPERPKISDSYHSDICDAVLYAWRECRHYLSEKPAPAIKPGTDEAMDELERQLAEECERKKEDPYAYELEKQIQEDMDEMEEYL